MTLKFENQEIFESGFAFVSFLILCGVIFLGALNITLLEVLSHSAGLLCAVIICAAGMVMGHARNQVLDSGILASLSIGIAESDWLGKGTYDFSSSEQAVINIVAFLLSCLLIYLTPKISDVLIFCSGSFSRKLSAMLWPLESNRRRSES